MYTMEPVGTGTRYVFTALHRDAADLEINKTSGFYQGTEIAVDQFVEHVIAMKEVGASRGGRIRHPHAGLDNKRAATAALTAFPRSRGGDRSGGNLVTACGGCNVLKGHRRLAEFLRTTPAALANFRRFATHVWPRHLRTLEEEIGEVG